MTNDFWAFELIFQDVWAAFWQVTETSQKMNEVWFISYSFTSSDSVMFEMFPALCPLTLAVSGIVYLTREQSTPLDLSGARRCKHTPTHMDTDKEQSTVGESVTNSICHNQAERNLLWWTAYCQENKHTLFSGLIWTVTPSVSPTQTVGQHNGPVCTHSNIPLTLENRNKLWRRRLSLDLHPATILPTLLPLFLFSPCSHHKLLVT